MLIGIRNVMGIMTVVTGQMSPIVTGKQDMDMTDAELVRKNFCQGRKQNNSCN